MMYDLIFVGFLGRVSHHFKRNFFSISHHFREENMVADFLAWRGEEGYNRRYDAYELLYKELKGIMRLEKLGLPYIYSSIGLEGHFYPLTFLRLFHIGVDWCLGWNFGSLVYTVFLHHKGEISFNKIWRSTLLKKKKKCSYFHAFKFLFHMFINEKCLSFLPFSSLEDWEGKSLAAVCFFSFSLSNLFSNLVSILHLFMILVSPKQSLFQGLIYPPIHCLI